jgi:hypothetical protein
MENSADSEDLTHRRETAPEVLGATLEERLAAQGDARRTPPRKPPKKRADGRPSGIRRAQAQIQRDMAKVKELMEEGVSRSDILAEIPKMSVRTVDRYMAHVHEQRRRDAEMAKPFEVQSSIARISVLSRKAEKEAAWGAVARFESMLLDIRGMRAPERHDVRAVVAQVSAPVEDFDARAGLVGATDEELAAVKAVAQKLVAKASTGIAGLIGDTTVEE